MRKLSLAAIACLAADFAQATSIEIDIEGQTSGTVTIDLLEDVAPAHVERITTLAQNDAYDGVVFHRVIDGFMAQTGDVEFGQFGDGYDARMVGRGGSDMANLPPEFSDIPFDRGTLGMARSQAPNSANSQFFITLADAPHLNGSYTVFGEVTDGMDVVDAIKRGQGPNGMVQGEPDRIADIRVIDDAGSSGDSGASDADGASAQ